MIAIAKSNHVKDLIRLHQKVFKGLFSERIGCGYLQLFYSSIVNSAYSKGFIYLKNNEILGFIGGVCDNGRLFNFRSKIHVALSILEKLLVFEIRVIEVIDFIRYFLWVKKINSKAELLSLMVDKDHRSQGIGTKLLEKLIDYYREIGINKFIVFSHDKFSKGIDFYKRRHFRVVDRIKQDNHHVFCLLHEIRRLQR